MAIKLLPNDLFKDGITPLNAETFNSTIVAKINEIVVYINGNIYPISSANLVYVRPNSTTIRTYALFKILDKSDFSLKIRNNSTNLKVAVNSRKNINAEKAINFSHDIDNPSDTVAYTDAAWAAYADDSGWINNGGEYEITSTQYDSYTYLSMTFDFVSSSTGAVPLSSIEGAIDIELKNVEPFVFSGQKYFNDSAVRYVQNTSGLTRTNVDGSTGTPTPSEIREAIELELVNVTSI